MYGKQNKKVSIQDISFQNILETVKERFNINNPFCQYFDNDVDDWVDFELESEEYIQDYKVIKLKVEENSTEVDVEPLPHYAPKQRFLTSGQEKSMLSTNRPLSPVSAPGSPVGRQSTTSSRPSTPASELSPPTSRPTTPASRVRPTTPASRAVSPVQSTSHYQPKISTK